VIITGSRIMPETCRVDWSCPRLQKQVADLSADGWSAGVIAARLNMSKGQVAAKKRTRCRQTGYPDPRPHLSTKPGQVQESCGRSQGGKASSARGKSIHDTGATLVKVTRAAPATGISILAAILKPSNHR
jgi:hypothetical protein